MHSPLLSPFAGKFLLPGRFARASGWGGCLPYYLDLSKDLNWHLQFNRGNPVFTSLLVEWRRLAQESPPRLPPSRPADQPTWDLHEDRDQKEEIFPDQEIPRRSNGGLDLLAHYVPAHDQRPDEYGIHLLNVGIAHLADDISAACSGQPEEAIVMSALFPLAAHEYCHAYIEDLCCLVDFATGRTATPIQDRRYVNARLKYGDCLFMEEALCNTAAWGWLYEFLHSGQHSVKKFNPGVMLKAFYAWMRNQPKGYCDFLAICTAPDRSNSFLKGIRRLLIEVYGFDSQDVPEVEVLRSHHAPAFATSAAHTPLHLEDGAKTAFYRSDQKLTDLTDIPGEIRSGLHCRDNKLESLEHIHKRITKTNGTLDFRNNPIKSHVLGVLLIEGTTKILLDEQVVQGIVNKYLPNTRGNAAVIECQNELIDAGLKEYAML